VAQEQMPAVPSKSQERAEAMTKDKQWVHYAGDVIGAKVENAQRERIGEVDDLLFDSASGECRLAVVDIGGVLGIGETRCVVPIAKLACETKYEEGRAKADEACFRLTVDREKLENAPKLPDDLDDPASSGFEARVLAYYGASDASAGKPADATRKPGLLLSADRIQGMDLHGTDGKKLGEIGKLVLAADTCRIACFTLETGGFLGLGEKVFALPWQAVTVTRADDDLRLTSSVTEAKLAQAPEFDEKRMGDRDWMHRVFGYYSIRPSWTEAVEAGHDKRSPPGGGMDAAEPGSRGGH
jgi:sporulation protein YlmC with PRC-barrel domain